jgi:hypothetical protein
MAEGSQGGRKGKSKATVHEVFRARVRELRSQAVAAHNAHQGKSQRSWQVPEVLETSLMAIADLHKPAFDRDEINTQYSEVTKSPDEAGTMGDVIALKLQLDYNACEERAFRARHTTLCRAMCLGHGRRVGHGHGGVWDPEVGVEGEVASFIAAGGAPGPGDNITDGLPDVSGIA